MLLLAVPLLIALNAFFVAAEYTLVAIRPAQIEGLRGRRSRRTADAIESLKSRAADAIGTIQVCITMTNLLLGWIGEPAMSRALHGLLGPLVNHVSERVFHAVSVTLSFIVVTLLTVVFSELLPKALTLRYVPTTAVLTAVPILGIRRVVRPLVWLMNKMANAVTVPLGLGRVDDQHTERVTAEEIRLMTTEAAADGVLTARERALILNTLALGDRRARHVMIPRIRVVHLDLQWTMEENRNVINQRLYSRLPLCDGGLDNVVGILHVKEFLSAYNAAGDVSVLSLIARPPVFVPETTPTDKLITAFREKRSQMLLVADEYGGLAGVVTLRDVVDDLLGLSDEKPAATAAAPSAAGAPGAVAVAAPARPEKLVVPGDTTLHELAQMIDKPGWGADEESVTVGGLIQDRLGVVGQGAKDARVEVDGVRLRVVDIDERSIRRVEVKLIPEPEAL